MKLRNILLSITVLTFVALPLFAQNTNPVVENVVFTYSGTTVTITYDLKDAEQTTVNVRMLVSENSGATWTEKTSEATGDIGDLTDITATATQKTITWTYNGSNQSTMKIKILANDKTADGSPCPGTPTVTYSNKTYNTIQIADQCWLKENLNVGTMINSSNGGTNSDGKQTNNGTIEKYCYNNVENNCTTYGGLYQWDEAIQYVSGGTQGICPTGWHIPTIAEMQTLQTYVNNEAVKLIDKSQTMTSGLTPTNESGFSALFVGQRDTGGNFGFLSSRTYFWSSTGNTSDDAFDMCMYYDRSSVDLPPAFYRSAGFSVRCLKDN